MNNCNEGQAEVAADIIKRPGHRLKRSRQILSESLLNKLAVLNDLNVTPVLGRNIGQSLKMSPKKRTQEKAKEKTKEKAKEKAKEMAKTKAKEKAKTKAKKPVRRKNLMSRVGASKKGTKTRRSSGKKQQQNRSLNVDGDDVYTRTLNRVRRKKWVNLNSKQKEYIAELMNSAITYATSTLPSTSEQTSSLDNFLHAVKIKLLQQLNQTIVPPLSCSAIIELDKLVNFSNIIQEFDDRIETLNNAIDEEDDKIANMKQKLRSLTASKKW